MVRDGDTRARVTALHRQHGADALGRTHRNTGTKAVLIGRLTGQAPPAQQQQRVRLDQQPKAAMKRVLIFDDDDEDDDDGDDDDGGDDDFEPPPKTRGFVHACVR